VCTLAVYVGVFPAYPVVVAANRDELLARPSAAPGLLRETAPRVFGGRDLVAGGTWLGLSERGLVAGMLNRRSAEPPDPTAHSRGLLCLDALARDTAAAAAGHVAGFGAGLHNPFNLLLADPAETWVVTQARGTAPRAQRLAAGLHLLTNLDLNDATCPRIAASHRHFADAATLPLTSDGDVAALVRRLQSVLADHDTALDPRGPGSLCVHAAEYGTRSSSVVLVPPAGGIPHWFHADGPPCRAPLRPLALPF
jgi:uncharacterized protein with NRDE domain